MWYLQAQYLHHKQEKSHFPSQPSTLLALFCSQIFTIFPMYGTGSPYLKQSVFSFFPIYFILFFNLVCFLEFSLCHQHIHYASERRFSCAIDWKLKLKTMYMFICSYTRSPTSYIYRVSFFMVWITGPRITSMSQILWEERKRNCLNIWIHSARYFIPPGK